MTERDTIICQLWREGYKAREIAARVRGGMSVAGVYKVVERSRLRGENLPRRFAAHSLENYNRAFRERLHGRAEDVRITAVKKRTSADTLLTYQQAAALMGVHESTLRRAVRAGALPYQSNNGWHKRFRLVDLVRWGAGW